MLTWYCRWWSNIEPTCLCWINVGRTLQTGVQHWTNLPMLDQCWPDIADGGPALNQLAYVRSMLAGHCRRWPSIEPTCLCWINVDLILQMVAQHWPNLHYGESMLAGHCRRWPSIEPTCLCWINVDLILQMVAQHWPNLHYVESMLDRHCRRWPSIEPTCLC